MFKTLTAATSMLAISSAAIASCPISKVLEPLPGEVSGCPVYSSINANGQFWFSDFAEPADNNLYGFQAPAPSAQVSMINAITSQNYMLIQLGNAWSIDFALTPVTFTPTAGTFSTADGPVIVITGDVRQGC